jgi:small nuclear ribonucleoprotein (snRNP)-like protein
VEVELANKEKYKGILQGCSPDFNIGLSNAQKMPVTDDDRLCMTTANTTQKIVFPSKDVVCVVGVLEPKNKEKNGCFVFVWD